MLRSVFGENGIQLLNSNDQENEIGVKGEESNE